LELLSLILDSLLVGFSLGKLCFEGINFFIEKVRVINEKVDALKAQLAEAEANKKRVEDEAQELQD
jgi:cell division protein FtsB